MNFPFGKSALRKAIERGLAKGNLSDELSELGDIVLKSPNDAEAVCWGLRQLKGETEKSAKQVSALVGLFQDVDSGDCAAAEILREDGTPELLRLFDEFQTTGDGKYETVQTQFYILKIFAFYGTTEGALKIIEAARQPLDPTAYMWNVILGSFREGHPQNDLLYRSLREPLPRDFIAISLLDAANAAIIGGESMSHPFDCIEGTERLKELFGGADPDEFSYAHSAAAALPFISDPGRDSLLELAMKHPDVGVRVEAAWAAAKIGKEEGIQHLIAYCRDFKTAEVAKHYLTELGKDYLIPAEAKEGGFSALSEFARWCAHPNELGQIPDELSVVDHRELPWPPEKASKPFWLIKYRVRDTTGLEDDNVGCGLVGSVTFCLFSYKLDERPPEDAYAIHCFWEMQAKHLIEKTDVRKESSEYEGLLRQWRGKPLENPKILFVSELSPELKCPQRLVGLASARLDGDDGWAVLDGERSAWYSRAEMPSKNHESIPLMIHVGSHLLNFKANPERKRFLAPSSAPKEPEKIIAAYEKCLADARRRKGKKRERAFGFSSPVTRHFGAYIEALIKTGHASKIPDVLQVLALEWDHVSGFGRLGTVAYTSGHYAVAEQYLLKYRQQCENYERGEEMDLLADIWARSGRIAPAQELLLDCLQKLLKESKIAPEDDRQQLETWFQTRRIAFLKLNPKDGASVLVNHGIPTSIFTAPR